MKEEKKAQATSPSQFKCTKFLKYNTKRLYSLSVAFPSNCHSVANE